MAMIGEVYKLNMIILAVFLRHLCDGFLSSTRAVSLIPDTLVRSFTKGSCGGVVMVVLVWWRHQMETFLCYWPFVRGIHRSPVNSLHKGQWRGALMFSLICAWINRWVNNCEAGDFRHCRAHYDVIVMVLGGVGAPMRERAVDNISIVLGPEEKVALMMMRRVM